MLLNLRRKTGVSGTNMSYQEPRPPPQDELQQILQYARDPTAPAREQFELNTANMYDVHPMHYDQFTQLVQGGMHPAMAAKQVGQGFDMSQPQYGDIQMSASPMDLAFRLLKDDNPLQHVEAFLNQLTPDDTGVERLGDHTVHFEGFTDMCNLSINPNCSAEQLHQEVWDDFDKRQGATPIHRGKWGTEENPTIYSVYYTPQEVQTGEPMDIAMRLLKERVSPEAMRHKLEYDKQYESSPERVKYREELNRERRRRGIMGSHDHMDVSHTQGNKLTLESEHDNRARHFKNRGTLRQIDKVE